MYPNHTKRAENQGDATEKPSYAFGENEKWLYGFPGREHRRARGVQYEVDGYGQTVRAWQIQDVYVLKRTDAIHTWA